MGHDIPVFFFPIDREFIPSILETWSDAESLIGDYVQNNPPDSYYVSSSRNWWHQDATVKLCKKFDIVGLDFTIKEVVALCNRELEDALSAVDALLEKLSTGIPDLGVIEHGDGTLYWLTRDLKCKKTIELSKGQMIRAYKEAVATYNVDEGSVIGYKSLVGYFSFLKTLRQAIMVAQSNNKCLFYVMPQP